MAKQIPWCKGILETFITEGCLTREEESVLRARVSGLTIQEQADSLNMSIGKVNRITARLKSKYDIVQGYCPSLPKRATNQGSIWGNKADSN